MATKHIYPLCEHDLFPLVRIDGRLECAAEYLDRCLGLKRVVDMIPRDQVAFYVFEDGHELPLLCFCCGEPLTGFDLEESRRRIRGRRLEQMSMTQVAHDGGDDLPQFRLEFSKRGLFSHSLVVPLSPEVAARMRHPDTCPHKPQPPSPERRRGKQR
ncbi:hypothetical protein ARNL5_03919 [Anaerolineae bacterium]|nr:hypothetical protein ARNL5_03919 [Anaerolineae bacterium]